MAEETDGFESNILCLRQGPAQKMAGHRLQITTLFGQGQQMLRAEFKHRPVVAVVQKTGCKIALETPVESGARVLENMPVGNDDSHCIGAPKSLAMISRARTLPKFPARYSP